MMPRRHRLDLRNDCMDFDAVFWIRIADARSSNDPPILPDREKSPTTRSCYQVSIAGLYSITGYSPRRDRAARAPSVHDMRGGCRVATCPDRSERPGCARIRLKQLHQSASLAVQAPAGSLTEPVPIICRSSKRRVSTCPSMKQ